MGPFSDTDGLNSYITLWNRTSRRAAIFWYDFGGKLVRYGVLSPGERLSVDTYTTHPWCCRDEESWDILILNESDVLYPKEWGGGETRDVVTIDIPVYKLVERCQQIVRQYVDPNRVFDLEIPFHLKFDLHRIESYDFTLYQNLI